MIRSFFDRIIRSHLIPSQTSTFISHFHSKHSVNPSLVSQAPYPLPLNTGRERVVILGTGWAASRFIQDLDPKKYDFTVISPRNHMIFTPLLSSTCTGTLETRSVTLPIVDIQKALRQPQNYYFCGQALAVHPRDCVVEASSEDGLRFFVPYDILVVATGSQGSTFGIPGVIEHATFLREAHHAMQIRNSLIENWNRANIPGRTIEERHRLLHTIVVGGGPTGVEFSGDLADFINKDLDRIDPDRARDMRITLVEENELLGSFDARLREYAAQKLVKEGVRLLKGVVKEVRHGELELHTGQVLPFGLCVWSTGVGPTPFTLSLPFLKTNKGRIAVDDRLRVMSVDAMKDGGHDMKDGGQRAGPSMRSENARGNAPMNMSDVSMLTDEEPAIPLRSGATTASLGDNIVGEGQQHHAPLNNVFSLGDCSANFDRPLPALAQVAEQQGKYLAKMLNRRRDSLDWSVDQFPPFVYRSLGAMATVGGTSAIIELQMKKGRLISWAGFTSWIAWRSAYLTRLGTLKARLYVVTNWTLSLLFGRDISRW